MQSTAFEANIHVIQMSISIFPNYFNTRYLPISPHVNGFTDPEVLWNIGTVLGLYTAVYHAIVIIMLTGISTGIMSATPIASQFMYRKIPLPA